MTSRFEYTASDDAYLVPSDKETVEACERFGKNLQERIDMMNTFLSPDTSISHTRIPFGRFGDDTLTIVREKDSDGTSVNIGYRSADNQSGFYASRTAHATHWAGNGSHAYTDKGLTRMLDANWPSFTIDAAPIRGLIDKGDDVSFEDISTLLEDAARTDGTNISSTQTFTDEWQWQDGDTQATGTRTATIERIKDEKPTYKFEVTLPHRYAEHSRTDVTCIARFDAYFGVTFEVKVEDPTLSKLDIDLIHIIELLDFNLQELVDEKISRLADQLPSLDS